MKNTILLFAFIFSFTFAVSQELFNAKNGIAIEGYDVVSYFEGKVEKGSESFISEIDGVIFCFTSEDHRMQFEKAPLQFIPQYGGFCAYAMGKSGEKVAVNPKAYLISEGKLYLFYKNLASNTLKKWMDENPEKLQLQADENWIKIISN